VHCALGLSPQQGLACSAKQPSPLGRFGPRLKEQGRQIPLGVGGLPAKSGRPAAVGRRGSGLEANSVDGDPDLGRRVVGGSSELGHDGDGGRSEGCAVEGVDRLSLARLVRSASTSELGRLYWRGQRGRRSTRGGDRWWPTKRRKRWPVTTRHAEEWCGETVRGAVVGEKSSTATRAVHMGARGSTRGRRPLQSSGAWPSSWRAREASGRAPFKLPLSLTGGPRVVFYLSRFSNTHPLIFELVIFLMSKIH
jgi:hypothetical protein